MITPLEIQNHQFKSKLRGFDREEVRQFLHAVGEEVENLIERNHLLESQVATLNSRLSEHEDRDKVLKDTLIAAQQIKREIRENAKKEADLLVREGQLKADAMVEDAREEVRNVGRQVSDVRRLRNDLLAEVEMLVTRFNHFLEAERLVAEENDKVTQISGQQRDAKAEKSAEASAPQLKPLADRKPVRKSS